MEGIIGHLLIISGLVTCLVSGVSFFKASYEGIDQQAWLTLARRSWWIMSICLVVASVILSYLIFSHQFQYAYVWQQSSRDLPGYFLFSSFWAGQEGSFMLWIFLMCFMGIYLIRWGRDYEAPVMATVAICQFFLVSMVVGLQFGSVSIGSSPFALIYDKFPNTPAGYIPPDGSGLNDLLQNYWMAIHPPMLFVGFTAMVVPFGFAVAALWKKKYTEWVRPALPWTLFAVMVLMVGIAMGGYWAYETLNFGGYWAWDPVENSSLVPWLFGVSALHMMIVQKKSGASHKAALFLCVLGYITVIYSTFLTRSGILGDTSVHSFVDLGLYNQLLMWILTIAAIGFGLFAYRYRDLPTPTKEPGVLSREFMIFSGALLLSLTSVVITMGTSAPILGRLFRDNPSAVPISFYNEWSIPLAIGFIFLLGMGQLFWWNKMSVVNVNEVLLKPILLSVASTIAVLIFTPFVEKTATPAVQLAQNSEVVEAGFFFGISTFWSIYGDGLLLLILLFVTFFALFGNGIVLWRIGRGNLKLAGGAITHIGFVIMILGIIASSSFSNVLAPETGEESRGNFVLSKNESRTIEGYTFSYTGVELNEQDRPVYFVDVVDERGRVFEARPIAYKSNKDQWILHPDVSVGIDKDIFLSIQPMVMFDESGSSQGGGSFTLQKGESITLGNDEFDLTFDRFDVEVESDLVPWDSTEIAVAAVMTIVEKATGMERELRPIYLVLKDGQQQFIQNRLSEWGLSVAFSGMNVDNGSANFVVDGRDVAQEDWVVVQAYEKPLIFLVWLGIIMLSCGFILSMLRRSSELVYSMRRSREMAS